MVELAAIVAGAVILTLVPQRGERGAAAFRWEHPALAPLLRALGLDRVLTSTWFLFALALSTASLTIVVVEQWQRARREWRTRLSEASFLSAPFQRTFERATRPGASSPGARFETRGRIALLGSPLFHTGLLAVVIAGLARALFVQEAIGPMVEGDVIGPGPEAWAAHHEGFLARPFSLGIPVRLSRLDIGKYPSGDLRSLSALVSVKGGPERRLAINEPLDLPSGRLYLDRFHGLAAILDLQVGAKREQTLVYLEEAADDWLEGEAVLSNATVVRVRCPPQPEGRLPGSLELRVMRGGALLFAGRLKVRQGVQWSGAERIAIAELRNWAELRGTRDPSLGLLYVGAFVTVLGVALMFSLVRVDTVVVVTPAQAGERVFVALRAQRFAPVYRERFQLLVRREGGGPV
ncbi:MAG TPA: cytochrome c biogenesis protein ResB [Anaeromyxobacteraceae bacterium]|nr:cytochrome c biogenesis protein ResB [Anaeromyxobacteraceae bacterium]